MPGRKYTNGSAYRYGFNGKENDKDAGEGIQDYGMRINDVRLGRFLSIDPITKSYPMLTPYQFASNRPIDGADLDGLEWDLRIKKYQNQQVVLQTSNEFTVKLKVINQTTLSDEKLKAHLNLVKIGSEQILQTLYESSSYKENFSVKIEYDFSNTKDNPDNGFTLVAVNKIEQNYIDKINGTNTLAVTSEIGNTQQNKIVMAIDNEIEVNTGMGNTTTIYNGLGRQSKSLAEEIGHTGSLGHVGINSFNDRPDETSQKVIDYTGATDPNTNVMIQRGTAGASSTMNGSQFKKITEQIEKDTSKEVQIEKSKTPLF